MKKEKSMASMIITELAVGAAEILLVLAALFGFLYAIGFVAEMCDGLVSASTAVFAMFTAAGLILYLDFKPSGARKRTQKRPAGRNREVCATQRKALRAYSAR